MSQVYVSPFHFHRFNLGFYLTSATFSKLVSCPKSLSSLICLSCCHQVLSPSISGFKRIFFSSNQELITFWSRSIYRKLLRTVLKHTHCLAHKFSTGSLITKQRSNLVRYAIPPTWPHPTFPVFFFLPLWPKPKTPATLSHSLIPN